MSYKHLLKFYFFADSLNKALDDVCMRYAMASADCFKGCGYYAEKIGELIEAKSMLGELWSFLDGVLGSMAETDRRVLLEYSSCGRKRRSGSSVEVSERDKAVHRALMKLSRRVKDRLQRYEKQVNVLCVYYSLVRTS